MIIYEHEELLWATVYAAAVAKRPLNPRAAEQADGAVTEFRKRTPHRDKERTAVK